ncbi:hypothetical protein GLYMA_06G074260v4 [Glycine max]|nr:hypothetical protein GLYMA_06G074260v4 [Glycine max]KAH1124631.1 hypothetical protein GYH30_014364 [Glycine max]
MFRGGRVMLVMEMVICILSGPPNCKHHKDTFYYKAHLLLPYPYLFVYH